MQELMFFLLQLSYLWSCILTGDRVACMINNLGGMSVLEINVAANETIKYLGQYTYSFNIMLQWPGMQMSCLL